VLLQDPQFANEKVLLFCSDKYKREYLKMKLRKIKTEYPKYYDKLKKSSKESIYDEVL